MRAWADPSYYFLMGPDNFDKYYRENVCWAHDPVYRENPVSRKQYGFRNLYDNLIGPRVLVYPELHSLHATDIRKNLESAPEAVRVYIEREGLYQNFSSQKKEVPKGSPEVSRDAESSWRDRVLDSLRIAEGDLGHIARSLQQLAKEHGFKGETVARLLIDSNLLALDPSQLADLRKSIDFVVGGVRTGDSTVFRQGYTRQIEVSECIRDAAMNAILRGNIAVDGLENVLEAHRTGKRMVFLSPSIGPLEIGLLPYALRFEKAAQVAERLVFSVSRDTFSSPFEQAILGNGVGLVMDPESQENGNRAKAEPVSEAVVEHVVKRIRKGDIGATAPFFERATGSLCEIESDLVVAMTGEARRQKIDKEDIVIIPWTRSGIDDGVLKGDISFLSESDPVQIHFGRGIELDELMRVGGDPGVAAHALGYALASLLPMEYRGHYEYAPVDNDAANNQSTLRLGCVPEKENALGAGNSSSAARAGRMAQASARRHRFRNGFIGSR